MLRSADLTREGSAPLAPGAIYPVGRAAPYSVGRALPDGTLTSAELAQRLGVSEDWIVSRTGIRERPVAAPGERLSDLAARAGLIALDSGGIAAEDIDLVLVATMTADEVVPNAAPLVAHAIGARRAAAYDLGSACTGFLAALSVGTAQIETGRARWVLVIGADFITRVTDWDDRKSAPLFSDAAGAVVLGPRSADYGAVGPIVLGADGSSVSDAIIVRPGDRRLEMDGPEVYRAAVAHMSEATVEAVQRAALTLDDIDLFVYHQANARITRALAERLGLDSERVVDCIECLGNSSAATLPVALAEAESEGRLKPGTRVLLGAFGAGFTWGGAVVEWGGAPDD